MFEKSLEQDIIERQKRPVECLGMTFPSDEERRKHFLGILHEKLKDPEFRKIEGFPVGSDEDILALSDPPYYTACPNPFLADFIKHYGKPYDPAADSYRREPFAVDVSEGKTDPLYKAHSYHTKVPHLAIVPSILHYTRTGDIVLDGFAGSGMTAVAAQWCGSAPAAYRHQLEQEWQKAGLDKPEWGARRAIVGDLSPAASFIAANYNLPFDVAAFEKAARRVLKEVEQEIGWMYETLHTDGKTKGRINYTVWSEVFTCPDCSGEVVFLEEALDKVTKRVKEEFPCPRCGARLTKNRMERFYESKFDLAIGETVWVPKRIAVLINYTVSETTREKTPDDHDRELLKRVGELPPPEIPIVAYPFDDMWEAPRLKDKGITHTHHLFLPRQAQALGLLWCKARAESDPRLRNMLLFFVEQALWTGSALNRFRPTGYSQVNQYLTGVYYVPSQISEPAPWYILDGKAKRLAKAFAAMPSVEGQAVITTGTAAVTGLPDSSIDYIFTDPPFGDNYPYAELNFLVEAWHRLLTSPASEAIVDRTKKNRASQKNLQDYQRLMEACFREYRRVLKPGRWMTVVFHNSRNAVWNAIQEAMQTAGFVVADVRTLDKKQGSFKQVTAAGTMKQDLVISAYKPNGGLEQRFKISGGTEDGVWDFVRTHLKNLPVFVTRNSRAEAIAERQPYFLYDRMVAFHVQRGMTIPLSAAEFYQGLSGRFIERSGMYFLSDQAPEYDKKRLLLPGVAQLEITVSDEVSALEWLRQELKRKPQTFQELQPRFMEITRAGWLKHEKPLELSELLEQNLLHYDGKGEVPNQIHSYLSTNFKELRNLPKDAPELRAKAKDRWYVPDPNKAGDLEKLRERSLLKEFFEYLPPGYKPVKPDSQEGFIPGLEPKPVPVAKGKKMKVMRLEAVRAGFKQCWQNRDYRTIIAVAQRIPETILQEDPKLLMWYDQALTRSGRD